MLKEIKSEKVKGIFEEAERQRKYYEDEFMKKMEAYKDETERMVDEKIKYFEDRLVSKLLKTLK